jgi:O-methyltransferase domain
LFDATRSDPEFRALFHKGLASRTRNDAAAVAEAYDFSDARKVVDIGGGSGSLLSAILSRHEHISGVLFDLAPAIEAAKASPGGPLPRTEFIIGDFFKDVPASADIYLLKWILHDWGDDEAVRILATCRRFAATESKVLVIEGLLGAPNELTLTNLADINMMLMTGRGRERTEAEFAELFDQAGFALRTVMPTRGHLSILEAVPV